MVLGSQSRLAILTACLAGVVLIACDGRQELWPPSGNGSGGAPSGSGGRGSGGNGTGGAMMGVGGSGVGGSGTGGASAACAVDGSGLPGNPVSGIVAGTGVSADICQNGAFAYLERPVYSSSPFIMIMDTSYTVDPTTVVQFQLPADATAGELAVLTGVTAASPGKYGSADGACGEVVFCASLPVPPSVNCAGATSSCPPGCALAGSALAPQCQPVTPESCYQAQAAGDCLSNAQTPEGSWTLELTSVAPMAATSDGLNMRYFVHGTFTATMIGDDGTTAATLSLTF